LASVPAALAIRAGQLPSQLYLSLHVLPFSIIAGISILIFFSAGLYDRATALMRRELVGAIIGAEIVNVIIAALMFNLIPLFVIAPKTNLIIYLAVSIALVSAWRITLPAIIHGFTPRTAAILATGPDVRELIMHCGRGKLCPLEVVAPTEHPDLVVTAADFIDLYERVFRRVPLSTVSEDFLAGAAPQRLIFDITKRILDFVLCVPLLIVLMLLTPFVFVLMHLEGPGPLFIRQSRIGRGYRPITVTKFRTMTESDAGVWKGESTNRVTSVGAFLRRTSIDELPQVLAVLAGSLSLIGPRSDVAALADRLSEAIPFYRLRYQVTPGISGWAQVHQKYAPGNISPQSIEESRVRLAYDLYYVKHRSPFLDLSIAFRTLKTLILRVVPHG
jgi:lipopolysaccharide/colanic/teichoic acid biosynthesis glycosyltransferase